MAQSAQTYPIPARPSDSELYRITNTNGQVPVGLIGASVTFVGKNEIYLIGGFNRYTDEVFNHVFRLNLDTPQRWDLVDNHGDVPDVRTGHTATLWGDDKLLIFGGENEHRVYHSDLLVFDIPSAHWTRPEVRGQPPQGRARHAAVLHDEKLFIIGGLSGSKNNTVLDDICFLDLKTWEWSSAWRFTPRFDHICHVWRERIYLLGGCKEWNGQQAHDVWSLDLKQSPFSFTSQDAGETSPTGPEPTTSMYSISGLHIPAQSHHTQFLVFYSDSLLGFATRAAAPSTEIILHALNLEAMSRETLAGGRGLFDPSYEWHYSALTREGTQAWLLGCPTARSSETSENLGGYLSHVLLIDFKKLGLLGNSLDVAHGPSSV